ncbi:MAG: hypothetical protein ACOYOK_00750 [Pseudobdellovibrionaceae bacterium]
MKTQIKTTQVFKTIQQGLLLVVMTLLVASCSKNNDSGQPPVPEPIYVNNNPYNYPTINGCQDCTGFTPVVLLNSAISSSSDYQFPLQITWQILGAQEALNQSLPASNMYANYTGPLMARGTLNFTAAVSSYYSAQCMIPAGQYNFETVARGAGSNGSWGVFSVQDLQATGPVSFRFNIPQGVIYKPMGAGNGGEHIYGSLVIQSVNGVSCNYGFGTTVN